MIEEELRKEIERLKSENARLAAALSRHLSTPRLLSDLQKFGADLAGQPHPKEPKILQDVSSALRDLLAPTMQLLESWMQWRSYGSQDKLVSETIHELSRLRSIVKGKV